jgi:hypothetical protein
MFRVRKKTLGVAGLVVVVATAGVLTAYFLTRDKNDSDKTVPFISALETSEKAIQGGITKENAEQALYVATNHIRMSQTAQARDMVQGIPDDLLTNTQLKTKFTILLDSYKIEQNKDGFTAAAEEYKKAIATRNDPDLNQLAQVLNQVYIDAVFTPAERVPEDQEIP